MSADHERIWLQNAEDAKHQSEGRMWCQDKVWPDDPEDGDPTEYVRADLYASLKEENDRLVKELEVLEREYLAEVDRRRTSESANEALRAALEEAKEMVRLFVVANDEAKNGLSDCVDNHGASYQSQYLADIVRAARALSMKGDQP